MRRKPLSSVLAILLTVACAEASPEPGGPDGVMLQYHLEGGFLPIDGSLRRGPTYTVTTDGRLIYEGPTIAIYPGPLVPVYHVVNLTSLEMRQLRGLIDRIGLPGITDEHDDTGSDVVADANTEVFTYWDANGKHRFSAYAPGFEDALGPRLRAFVELRDALSEITFSRDSEDYQPTRVRVLAGDEAHPDPDFVVVRDWPLPDTDLNAWTEVAFGWMCRAFDAAVLAQFRDAHQANLWRLPGSDGATVELMLLVRPLLPGEPDCPDL